MNSPVRVLLVDDHQVVLEGLAAIASLDPDIQVVGASVSASEGANLAKELQPDVAIFDVDFPGIDSFDIVPRLIRDCPRTRFVFLTAHLSDVFVHQAVQMAAAGYLLKEESGRAVFGAVKRACQGENVFSPAVLERLQFDGSSGRYTVKRQHKLFDLSMQQLAILRHLARGESVKQIALALGRSEKSVDSHKYRIMHKLGIHDRVELARYAIREGLSLV